MCTAVECPFRFKTAHALMQWIFRGCGDLLCPCSLLLIFSWVKAFSSSCSSEQWGAGAGFEVELLVLNSQQVDVSLLMR